MNARTEVAALRANIPALQMDEDELIKVLSTSLYPGADLASIKLVVGWCRAQHKDPMKRPVHIVPMQVKVPKKDRDGNLTDRKETVWRDVLMPGIGDYRTDAARTGEYAGISEAKFGPDIKETFGGEPKKEWDERSRSKVDTGRTYDKLEFSYPEWCEISVFRLVQGVRCEFSSGKVYFKEIYATAGNDTSLPNAMWKKRPRGQLEKCAEAMALRRAFPEVGAQPTADELEGRTIDEGVIINGATGAVEHPKIPQPAAKPAGNEPPPAQPGQGSAAAPSQNGHAPGAASEADPAEADTKPMLDGQKRILRAKLKNASLNDIDLEAAFGKNLDMEGWLFADFQKVQDWIMKRAAGGQA